MRRARPLLGTLVEISAATRKLPEQSDHAEIARLHAAIDAAFSRVELVHGLMSYHDPDSDLSRLNRCGAGRAQRVHPHTYEVLTAAIRFARLSGGAFDPCVAAPLERWGYLPATAGPEGGAGEIQGGWQDIELLSRQRVRFRRPVRVDLGGIAKGFAVDLAVEALRRANVHEIIVNAGGDLRVSGTRPHRIFLRHPQAPAARSNPLQVQTGALASSGAYFSRRLAGGGEVSALVDPHVQQPYVGNDAVSVRAPKCITADALTKVVLFASAAIAERVLEECGAEALVLRLEGQAQGAM